MDALSARDERRGKKVQKLALRTSTLKDATLPLRGRISERGAKSDRAYVRLLSGTNLRSSGPT